MVTPAATGSDRMPVDGPQTNQGPGMSILRPTTRSGT